MTDKNTWTVSFKDNEEDSGIIEIEKFDETCGETEDIKIKYSMKKERKNARTKRN